MPIVFSSRVVRASPAQQTSGGGGGGGVSDAFDAEADWLARSSHASVFYANNLSTYSTDSEIWTDNYGGSTAYEQARIELETVNAPGAGKGVKINVFAGDDEGTAAWAISFTGVGSQVKTVRKDVVFFQFGVYIPLELIDTRWKTVGDTAITGLKLAILQEPDNSFGTGEVVVTIADFTKFIYAYRKRASDGNAIAYERTITGAALPGDTEGDPEYRWQNWINAGPQTVGADTDTTDIYLTKRRYGPLTYSQSGTKTYGGGTLTSQGQPDADSAVSGVYAEADAYNHFLVWADLSADSYQVIHAVRGQPPRLFTSAIGMASLGGTGGNNYKGVQLLPRQEERDFDVSQSVDTYAIYSEVLASDAPIHFPGFLRNSVAAPSWVASATVNRWYRISGPTVDLGLSATNTFNDIDPGLGGSWGNPGWEGLLISWNGGVFNPWLGSKGSMCFYGGGHGDWHGPQMVRFDIATRTWSIHNTVYPTGTYSEPASGFFSDDSPSPAHNYNQYAYDPLTNTAFCFAVQTSEVGPTKQASGAQYDFATKRWRRNKANSVNHYGSGGWAVWDTKRRVAWCLGAQTGQEQFAKFDPYKDNEDNTYGTWTSYGTGQFNAHGQADMCACYSPPESATVPDKIIELSPFGPSLVQIDPADPSTNGTTLTVSGTFPDQPEGGNLVYSYRKDAFYYYSTRDGVADLTDVFEIKKRSGSWSSTVITDAGNTVTPSQDTASSGNYGKFQIAEYMDAAVLFVVDHGDSAVYAMVIDKA